jgi:hypothetical protein
LAPTGLVAIPVGAKCQGERGEVDPMGWLSRRGCEARAHAESHGCS